MKNIFTIIIISSIFAFNFYLSGIYGISETFLVLSIYLIIFYTIHILWCKVRKKDRMDFYKFIKKFLYSASWFVLIIFICIGGFAYYFNEISPIKIPQYTLSNGEKIIKFQTMVHIGNRKYYDEVIADLTKFKEEGGVYFFEGVRSGSEKNMEKFNEALGIKFTPGLYKNFSKLYGVDFQNTYEFLELVNDLDFNVDITIDEIIPLYNEKIKNLPKSRNSIIPIDVEAKILDVLANINSRELEILVYLNKAILNFLMGNNAILKSMSDTFANKELFEVILGERNKVLVSGIENSEYDKIFITYGLLHFKGVYELLKAKDSRWKIIEEKWLYPISG